MEGSFNIMEHTIMIGKISFKCLFFYSIAKRQIQKPNQKSMVEHFCENR